MTYSQEHGSPLLKTISFQSLNWITATRSYNFGKIQNVGIQELSKKN